VSDFVTSGPTYGGFTLAVLRRRPDRTAFTWDGGSMTYGGALDLIGRMQAVFSKRGLRRGECVAFLAGNRAEAWCASIAAQASGLAVNWMHSLASVEDHLHQVSDSDAVALVVDARRFTERGGELSAKTDRLRAVFTLGPAEYGTDLVREADDIGAATPYDLAEPDDLALLNYTGGTTGLPKGAERRHRSRGATFPLAILADFEFPASPRYLAVGPFNHAAGTKVLPSFMRGGSVHLLDGFAPDRVLSAIERERVNFTMLGSTMIYALLDDPAMRTADLSSLELLLYGGSSISPDRLQEGLDRIGSVFSQLYGQTECYPISVLSRADHDPARPELLKSAGRPGWTSSVAVLDDEGNKVADGEVGELCVRSPLVMDGYRNLPELTAEAFKFGWLHTGDVGFQDENGYLYIMDRKKDMIIVNSSNVFAQGVEDVLMSHPGVAHAAVFGVPDVVTGEAVSAAIVLRPGEHPDPDELARYVQDRKGELQAPRHIHFVDRLPITSLGKVDKRALHATFAAD
jgi:fatty-acyl-CoA synthase